MCPGMSFFGCSASIYLSVLFHASSRAGVSTSSTLFPSALNPSIQVSEPGLYQTWVLRPYTESPQMIVFSTGSQNSVWSTLSPCNGPKRTIGLSGLPFRTKKLKSKGSGLRGFMRTLSAPNTDGQYLTLSSYSRLGVCVGSDGHFATPL